MAPQSNLPSISGWPQEFASYVEAALGSERTDSISRKRALVDDVEKHPHFRKAHPTIEHYLPLVVALGAGETAEAAQNDDRSTVSEPASLVTEILKIHDSWAFGDLSMSCFSFNERYF
jgi:4,5-DOPA dioxygenase extradiol